MSATPNHPSEEANQTFNDNKRKRRIDPIADHEYASCSRTTCSTVVANTDKIRAGPSNVHKERNGTRLSEFRSGNPLHDRIKIHPETSVSCKKSRQQEVVALNNVAQTQAESELPKKESKVKKGQSKEIYKLTLEQRLYVKAILDDKKKTVLASKFKLEITREDIETLSEDKWLNDNVINFYMNLLAQRGTLKHESDGLPKVYAMDTFFWTRLMSQGFTGVKRWTRKVDIFAIDIVLIPICVRHHWSIAIVHFKDRSIKFYDSMGYSNRKALLHLKKYLQEESLDKRQCSLESDFLEMDSAENIPLQKNGSDCGVFTCMYAENITRNNKISFSVKDVAHFRQRMKFEILRGELIH